MNMDDFREISFRVFFSTVADLIALPFYLLAIFMPTRSVASLRRIYDATFDALDVWDLDDNTLWNPAVRWFLITQAFGGIIDLIGISFFLLCLLVPWPVTVVRVLKLHTKDYTEQLNTLKANYENSRDGSRQSAKEQIKMRHELESSRHYYFVTTSCLCVGLAIRTLLEIASFPLLLVAVLVPTRTLPGLRMIGNVFYWRIFMKWDDKWGEEVDNTLCLQCIEYFLHALIDLCTLPALLTCILLGPFRLSKMYDQSIEFINATIDQNPAAAGHPQRIIWPSIWPCRSNLLAKADVTTTPFLRSRKPHIRTLENATHVLFHLPHYSFESRQMIWTQMFFCCLDLLILPFALLGLFGVVHTVPLLSDLKKHWTRKGINGGGAAAVPVANVSAPMGIAPTAHVPVLPGGAEVLAESGDASNPLQPIPWTNTENSYYDMFREKYSYNWLLRVDLFYHGVMTIVDILFLPPLIVCCVFCWRSKNLLLALRKGFDNQARLAILFAVFLVITDILLLPPLLVVLTIGWIFQRATPLSRQLCRRASATGLEESLASSSTTSRMATATLARSPSDRADIVQLNNSTSAMESGSSTGSSGATATATVTQVSVALEIKMETSEWYCLILRQFAFVLLDILVLPFTIIVFITRWRWHRMEVFHFSVHRPLLENGVPNDPIYLLNPMTNEGKQLHKMITKNLIAFETYNPKIDRDSGIFYHLYIIGSTLIVIHDIVLVLVIGPIACLCLYRIRRVVAILYKACTHGESFEYMYDQYTFGMHPWRYYMWKQLFMFLFVDIIGWAMGISTCVFAPHRIPAVWQILKDAYKHRTTPWCVSTTDATNSPQQPPQQGDVEMKMVDDTNVTRVNNNTQQAPPPQPLQRYPAWNGTFEGHEDGYWIEGILDQFVNGLIDIPFVVSALPVVITFYRLPKLVIPMYYNSENLTIMEKRMLPFIQMGRLLIDLLCIPLFVVVVGTLYRCFPAVKAWFSKRSKPSLNDTSRATVQHMKIQVEGRASTLLTFVVRIKSNATAPNDPLRLDLHSSPQLRIMGMSNLWKSITKEMGNTTSSLAQAYMPINLGKFIESNDTNEREISWSSVKDKSNEWDVKLRLLLPMKKTTLVKKLKLLVLNGGGGSGGGTNNPLMMNLQIETVQKGSGRDSLFSIVFPLNSILKAASSLLPSSPEHKDNQAMGSIVLGNTNASDGKPSWWTLMDDTNADLGSNADYQFMQSPQQLKQERGTKYAYTDMTDSFSLIFFQYFLMILRDLVYLAIALLVLILAPWRFIALLVSLCEPKRRFPVRVSGKLISKIYNSCDIFEEEAYNSLVIHANEHSKQVVKTNRVQYNRGGYFSQKTTDVHNPVGDKTPNVLLYTRNYEDLSNRKGDSGKMLESNLKRMVKAEIVLSKHEKILCNNIQKLNNLSPVPPYMNELYAYLKLRDQRLHYVAVHMHLNRARLCHMFPPNIVQLSDTKDQTDKYQEHEALPCLFELQRSEQLQHEHKCQQARHQLMETQARYEQENLKSVKCKKWGCWHKSEQLSRQLCVYMFAAGLRDWLYLILQLLLIATLYKIPTLCSDLSKIPRMSTCEAWCKFFSPSGSSRVRAVVRKHIFGIGRDIKMLLYNIVLFLGVCVLVVRFPKYLSHLPLITGLDELAEFSKSMIKESFGAFWELFLLVTASNAWKVGLRAVLFAILMPAAGLAELMYTVCPGLNESLRFMFGIVLWFVLFGTPLLIVNTTPKDTILFSLGAYSGAVLIILLLCWSASCFSTPSGRIVNKARWQAPAIRLDRYPNLLSMLIIPVETVLLLLLCFCIYSSTSLWPSIDEDTYKGLLVRNMNTAAIVIAFVWIFIVSVPLAVSDEDDRKKVQQSAFYSNTASVLSGCLFLPLIIGLILPMNCGNGPLSAYRNATTNSTYRALASRPGMMSTSSYQNATTNTALATNALVDPTLTDYVCWEGDHRTNIVLSAELLLVVMLTNIAAAVHDKTADSDGKPIDVGLDIIWANLFTAGLKLIQVVLVLAALMSMTSKSSARATLSNNIFVGGSIVHALWIPVYALFVHACCFPLAETKVRRGNTTNINDVIVKTEVRSSSQMIISSVPWLVWFRQFGFLAIAFAAVINMMRSTGTPINDGVVLWSLFGIIFLGIVVSLVARCCYRHLRVQAMLESGLPQTLATLIQLESELFSRGAFDSEWSLQSKDDSTGSSRIYDDASSRLLWKRRIKKITSPRHLATALGEFETHVLCENLHPAFFVIRNEWHDKLKDVQDNAGVRNLALQLKQHLRPLPKMQVIIHLVRQKMKAIRYVPPHALNTIMEFIGAYSTKTIFQTTDFSKYNASSSTDQYRYTFPHDLRDSWTNGLFANHRDVKKCKRQSLDSRKAWMERHRIQKLEIGSGAWFNSKYTQNTVPSTQYDFKEDRFLPKHLLKKFFKTITDMEVSWQTRSMYAQLMVSRVVYAVCRVELYKETEIKVLHRRQEAERQEMASVIEGQRLHALHLAGEKKEHKEDDAGEKKTGNGSFGSSMFGIVKKLGSTLANSIVDTVDGKWICKYCTYENKALHLQCLICQKENDTVSPLSGLAHSLTNVATGTTSTSTSTKDQQSSISQKTASEVHWNSLFATPDNTGTNGWFHYSCKNNQIWRQQRDHLFQAKKISDLVTNLESLPGFFGGKIKYFGGQNRRRERGI